ncbi:D-alanine--poly(phosphoribitol) ligase subunit 2 [Gimesia chilikensis]|uniref:D-alanine--poly(Phosphoribitol) ligase subunit 2 n=1 Tax=Gimesia chilikensis TaxID=2605989 RepID=A0A517WK58_9PLAN|nr:acyl carrier protein [Gimesia chilikensis]QDU05609.1 D-alanine--poly(phosphoribitol) ligase subunit 2 [Gimesia chilikensis]
MSASIQEQLVEFLNSVTGQTITDSTELIDSGLLDSLTMMDLLVFVESDFDVRLDFQDIRPDLFKNPATISQLIAERQAEQKKAA